MGTSRSNMKRQLSCLPCFCSASASAYAAEARADACEDTSSRIHTSESLAHGRWEMGGNTVPVETTCVLSVFDLLTAMSDAASEV
jgi:hypothetical protein